MAKPTTFKSGDIRTYEAASDAELQGEAQKLSDGIVDPKLKFKEKAGTAFYNSIVIGATLAPLTLFGGGAVLFKSEGLQKLVGMLPEAEKTTLKTFIKEARENAGLNEYGNKANEAAPDKILPALKNAQDTIHKITKTRFEALDKAVAAIERDASQAQTALQNLNLEVSTFTSDLAERGLSRFIKTTAAGTFGGASIIGTAVGLDKGKADKAVANSTRLSHAERILDERAEASQNPSQETQI